MEENVSFFEGARLICEDLPYMGLNLSPKQIDFLKSGGDGVIYQGNEFLEHHEFHYPARENPFERFTILTRVKWTQGHDDYEAFVMIEHDNQRQDARFVLKDEEGPGRVQVKCLGPYLHHCPEFFRRETPNRFPSN